MKFLKEKSIYPEGHALNPNSMKNMWIYIKSKELDIALKEWSLGKA